MASERKKGHFTFRTCAMLFMVSAVLELLSITSEAPLFGAIRGGITARIYHMIYFVLFLALGIGLWRAAKWGYALIFITTAVYTLDKALLLLSQQTMEAYAFQMQGALQLLIPGLLKELVLLAFGIVFPLFVIGWWGFALYTWWRRDYFKSP